MHRDTEIVHAGFRPRSEPGPFLQGPQFSSTYTSPGEPDEHALTYGRFHNPTWTAWEEALRTLEGGDAVVFSSGMAAVDAVLGTTLRPGDVLVLAADCYYTIRRLVAGWFERLGIEVRLVPTRGNAQLQALDGAKLVWVETPTNPQLDICDIAAMVDAAHARGITVSVANTTATPFLQQPLALGADFVVASDAKAITGHSDLILGHVATRDQEKLNALRTWRTQHGAIAGPMEVWLAHRSLPTLPLRVERQSESAMCLAQRLAGRGDLAAVHYPGLTSHPGHEVARRQMRAFGTIVSFDLETRSRAETFLRSLALVREATSFGGVHSMAERRARWAGDAISEGFIRFSVGCEAPDDILADVTQALDRAR